MAKENKFRTAYGDRHRVSFKTKGESLTQQHFEQEADVRNIIRQYDRTGLIANVQRGIAQYGDFSEVNEYREAMDIVVSANNTFESLPAEIRAKFNNDPGAFFEFATNPANKDEMVKMGLAEAPKTKAVEEATPAQTEVAEPPAPQKAGE